MIQGSGGAEARAGCALEIHETQQSQSKSTFSVHLQDPVGKYKSITITDDCYLIFLSHFSVSSYVLLSALLIEHYKLKPQKSQSDKKEKKTYTFFLSIAFLTSWLLSTPMASHIFIFILRPPSVIRPTAYEERKCDKDFEHVKGFCKQEESISSSTFTRDRQTVQLA